MRTIYGVARLLMAILMIVLAALGVLLTGFIPLRIAGAPLANWSVYAVIHLLCFLFRVRVHCTDRKLMRTHSGLIFPNHISVLDIIALLHCAPVRFLAAHDVEQRPLIGLVSRKIGTIFVNRESPRSRLQARHQVAAAIEQQDKPPVVLFPEGRLGPGDTLFPFRHGAFGIAVEGEIPYLPCALRYEPLDLVLWRAAADGEGMWTSIWRMVQYTGRVEVEVLPLEVVHPCHGDSPKKLAAQARRAIADALGLPLDVQPMAK